MLPTQVTGTITGTGAAINVVLGFKPKRVVIHNVTDGTGLEWTDTMGAGDGVATAAAGDRTFITSNGITQYAGAAGPAALTGTLAMTAGSAAITGSSTEFLSELKVGDIIAIPGVGAAGIGVSTSPDQAYVKVIAIASDTAATAERVADYACSGKTGYNTSGIGEGFTLGTAAVNGSGDTLHYIAERGI